MGIVDGDGNLLYTMVYEGYGAGYYFSGGSAAATMLLGTNPLGYRGYVMDAGTGLYYLQSRYYDPALGRFINADAFASTGQGLLGNNMFAYCGNNPINRVDPIGHAWWVIVIDVIINAAINVFATFIAAKATGQDYTWLDFTIMAFVGALSAFEGWGPPVGSALSGTYTGITSYQDGASIEGAIVSGVIDFAFSMIGIGDIAKYCGTTLKEATKYVAEIVFGTGGDLLSAGITQGITEKTSTTDEKVQVPDGWRYAGRTPYNP